MESEGRLPRGTADPWRGRRHHPSPDRYQETNRREPDKAPETLTALACSSVTLALQELIRPLHPQNQGTGTRQPSLSSSPELVRPLRATRVLVGRSVRQHTEGEARGSTFYRVIQVKLTNR